MDIGHLLLNEYKYFNHLYIQEDWNAINTLRVERFSVCNYVLLEYMSFANMTDLTDQVFHGYKMTLARRTKASIKCTSTINVHIFNFTENIYLCIFLKVGQSDVEAFIYSTTKPG